MQDFERVIEEGGDLVKAMLRDHTAEIRQAYLKTEDTKINLGLKLIPADGGIKLEASINFVESKITDSAAKVVSDTKDMFED